MKRNCSLSPLVTHFGEKRETFPQRARKNPQRKTKKQSGGHTDGEARNKKQPWWKNNLRGAVTWPCPSLWVWEKALRVPWKWIGQENGGGGGKYKCSWHESETCNGSQWVSSPFRGGTWCASQSQSSRHWPVMGGPAGCPCLERAPKKMPSKHDALPDPAPTWETKSVLASGN